MFDCISYSEFSISQQNLKAWEKRNTVHAERKKKRHKAFNIFPFQGQNSSAVHTKPTRRRALWADVLWLVSCAGSLCPDEGQTAVSADQVCAVLCCLLSSSLVTAHFSKHSPMGCARLRFNPWLGAGTGSFIKGCGLKEHL